MGHVWLARDERSGLDVALKIVAREGKSGHRAEREARAAASLRHPRCQRILSLARDPSHVYIAYEYIPGRTLREAIRAGEIDDQAAIEVAAQISEALAHAHAKGIVHRDVKPSNVLLAESGSIDVRLLDFGLAQMAEFDTLTALGDAPVPNHHLERDVQAVALVPREPHVSHAPRAERLEGPVPAQKEVACESRGGHPRELLPGRDNPCSGRIAG